MNYYLFLKCRRKCNWSFSRAGFTIVEMLVVIAIVAVLSAIVFSQISVARARARDARREADMKSLQNALALYNNNKGQYPPTTGHPYGPNPLTGSDQVSIDLKNENSLSKVPTDPLNAAPYQYSYQAATSDIYTLSYTLETDSIVGKSAGTQQVSP